MNELDKNITKLNNNEVSSKVTFYDELGNESKDKDFNTCVGCVIRRGNYIDFKVKLDKNARLYNPLEKTNNNHLDALDRNTKDNKFKLIAVNEACFDAYINFLKTKHNSILARAQREIV